MTIVLAAGQPDDRRPAACGDRRRRLDRVLLVEVAVLEHPGELDDALQLQLAPAAADAGPLEGVGEPAGFVAQALARRVERRDPLHAAARPSSTRRRSESLISRSTCSSVFAIGASRSSIAFLRASMSAVGFRARFAQTRFGEREKRLVVGLQRVGAQRLERFAQLRSASPYAFSRSAWTARSCSSSVEAGRARGATPASQPAAPIARPSISVMTDRNIYGHL